MSNHVIENVAKGTDTLGDTTGFTIEAGTNISSTTEQADTGTRSLKAIFNSQYDGFWFQATELTPGDSYPVSLKYISGQDLVLKYYDTSWNYIDQVSLPASPTFALIEDTLVVPAGVTAVNFLIYLSGTTPGTGYLDTVLVGTEETGGGTSETITKTPGTVIGLQDTEGVYPDWSNPTNAGVCDGTEANVTLTASPGNYSDILKATNFGLNIPPGVSIDGVKVEVKGRCATADAIYLYGTFLVLDNVIDDTRRYNSTKWINTATFYSTGSSSDLWGSELTPEILNDPDFGVAVMLKSDNAGSVTGYVDCIQLTVYYTVPNADLSVEVVADNQYPYLDEYVELSVGAGNLSELTAPNTVVELYLDESLEYIYHSCVQGTFDPNTGVWNLGDLAGGTNTDLHILYRAVAAEDNDISSSIESDLLDNINTNDTATLTVSIIERERIGYNYGFTFKNRHSSEFGIEVLDHPERGIKTTTDDVILSVPGRDGQLPVRQDDQARKLTIKFKVYADTPEDLRTLLYEIGRWFSTERIRNNVPVDQSLVFDDELDRVWKGFFTEEIKEKAEYNMAECTATFLVPTGTAEDITKKVTSGTGTNDGSVTVPCRVYVTSEGESDMIISNSQTGQSIVISRDFAEGEEVVVDTDKRTVTANQRDIRSYCNFNTSFFRLGPGAFTVQTTNGVVRKVEFTERYY